MMKTESSGGINSPKSNFATECSSLESSEKKQKPSLVKQNNIIYVAVRKLVNIQTQRQMAVFTWRRNKGVGKKFWYQMTISDPKDI